MRTKTVLILLLAASLLWGCGIISPQVSPTTQRTQIPTLEFENPEVIPTVAPALTQTPSLAPTALPRSPQQLVLDKAFEIINALKDKDMSKVSQYVHPQMGLRFSPYATVKDSDQVFTADDVAGLM